jgi:hypothetical protein
MDQHITKQQNSLCIWVTNYEERESPHNKCRYAWQMDCVPMDGEFGFGNQKGRYYEGNALIIDSCNSLVEPLSVSLAHFSRLGFKWVVEIDAELPKENFMITSALDTVVVFEGWMEIEGEEEVIDFEYIGFIYSVDSRNWFGIITVKPGQQLHLLSFSKNSEATVKIDDELYSLEYDCPMGKIKKLSRQPVYD